MGHGRFFVAVKGLELINDYCFDRTTEKGEKQTIICNSVLNVVEVLFSVYVLIMISIMLIDVLSGQFKWKLGSILIASWIILNSVRGFCSKVYHYNSVFWKQSCKNATDNTHNK